MDICVWPVKTIIPWPLNEPLTLKFPIHPTNLPEYTKIGAVAQTSIGLPQISNILCAIRENFAS